MTALVAISTVRRAAERAQRRFTEEIGEFDTGEEASINQVIAMAGAAVLGRFVEELAEEMRNPRERE